MAIERMSEEEMLRKEIEWAHEILDLYGAPKTIYNPYDHEDVLLNLPGRLSVWLDPANEGLPE